MWITGVDPGPKKSAYARYIVDCYGKLVFGGIHPSYCEYSSNLQIRDIISPQTTCADYLIIEQVVGFKKQLPNSLRDTIHWIGRFVEAWVQHNGPESASRIKLVTASTVRAKLLGDNKYTTKQLNAYIREYFNCPRGTNDHQLSALSMVLYGYLTLREE